MSDMVEILNVGEEGALAETSTKVSEEVSGEDSTSCKMEGDWIACEMGEGMSVSIAAVGRS